MSTRSFIAVQRDDGVYEGIYCHLDGYLTHNGAMLLDHYKDRKKLDKLIALGNISELAPKVEPDPKFEHSFDYGKRQEGVVVAYGRDRGEQGQENKKYSISKLLDRTDVDYIYVLDDTDKWIYVKTPAREFKDVKTDLNKEYKSMKIKRPKGYYGFWTPERIKEEMKKQKQEEM